MLLVTRVSFPSTDDSDEYDVLLGFRKLVELFWQFDETGAFAFLDLHNFEIVACANQAGHIASVSNMLQLLSQLSFEPEAVNEIQAVDLQASQHWMRFTLSLLSQGGLQDPTTLCSIAKDFVVCLSASSEDSIEAHGPFLVSSRSESLDSANIVFSKCRPSSLPMCSPTS